MLPKLGASVLCNDVGHSRPMISSTPPSNPVLCLYACVFVNPPPPPVRLHPIPRLSGSHYYII